jgi:hypothetical protein
MRIACEKRHRFPVGQPSTVSELCSRWDRDFVHNAYLTILRRPPDEGGEKAYLATIRNGAPKLQVIRSLYRSEEARHRKCLITGVERAVRLYDIASSRPIRFITSLVGLPGPLSNRAITRRRRLNKYYRVGRILDVLRARVAELVMTTEIDEELLRERCFSSVDNIRTLSKAG